ncbi:conjugal transfer coupling protein TraG [Aurantimonas sp. 22II-16-19i]|nr:conjugal transfer coupling protein TraG [Aurantimonas sp. 22II-16-19i]
MMQLPSSDKIVFVSGAPPVGAEKARNCGDRQFTARLSIVMRTLRSSSII